MSFVNQIAEVVHMNVDNSSGASNKNLGEAFLFVWRFPESEVDSFDGEVCLIEGSVKAGYVAEMAVYGFIKCIAKIHQYKHIVDYSRNKRLTSVIPGFHVSMGFGMHVGWAIEGSIGSHFKIDASYLSPHVNISARLEAATRQYGIPLLMSGQLFDLFTRKFKSLCRCIDIVTVKGSNVPMKFYTINLNTDLVKEIEFDQLETPSDEKKAIRKKAKEETKMKIFDMIMTCYQLLTEDADFKTMRQDIRGNQAEFDATYAEAFRQYVEGDWMESHRLLETCMELNPKDGPTKTLMHYIESFNIQSPESWKGFRELTSK